MEIIGRIIKDANVSTLPNQKEVVNFSIAVNDTYRKKGSEEPVKLTNYFNCSYWLSARIARFLTKGTLVQLQGRLSVHAWKNAEGEPKASLNFHVNSIKLHGTADQSDKENLAPDNPSKAKAKSHSIVDDLPF